MVGGNPPIMWGFLKRIKIKKKLSNKLMGCVVGLG
jgi:hypothetical protein